MVQIFSETESAGYLQFVIDSDPTIGLGLPAPLGAIAMLEDGSSRWIKDGTADTAWNSSGTTGQDLSVDLVSDLTLVGATLTPVPWNNIDKIDTTTFAALAGSPDITVLRDGFVTAMGQLSILFVTGGSNNSRSKATGSLYEDPINGGAGPFTRIRGTRSWTYHRLLAVGDGTLTLNRTFPVVAGTVLRYAVQRAGGNAGLSLDGNGCSMTMNRTG